MHVLGQLTRRLQPRHQHEIFGTGFNFSCLLWGWRVQASYVHSHHQRQMYRQTPPKLTPFRV